MKIAVFSDLHSNLAALEAMQNLDYSIDVWVSLGDSVGLLPNVNEVLEWQRNHVQYAVRGNHEDCLVNDAEMTHSISGSQVLEIQRFKLKRENFEYIKSLPSSLDVQIDGYSFRMEHAVQNVGFNGKYAIDIEKIHEAFPLYDYVLVGDTHSIAVVETKGPTLLNPGSAGFPISRSGEGTFVVLDTRSKQFNAIRFEIPTSALLAQLERERYPKPIREYVKGGFHWPGQY